MSLGETVQLTASVVDGNGELVSGADVVWSSSDPQVASVSGQGLVTAVGNGSATVTARSGSASASVPVTVMQSAGSVVIEPAMATLMSLGETVQLTASVLDGNGQPVAGAVVAWSSSDPQVASVNGQGLVTAEGNGSATVTARSGSASASVPVTVMQSAGSVVIEPAMATLMSLGETVQLTASVLDGNGQPVAGAVVAWSSSDPQVASVNGQGLVTAEGNGSATVTARSGSASASVPVTVMQSAGSVVIEPAMATLMSLGETVQLTASVLDGNGQPVAGAVVAWSSSDPQVASVNGQGLVTAEGNGSATVTARSGSASASVPVSVMGPNPDRAALVALYNETDGPLWINDTDWLSDAPLGDWYGVSTDENGRVIGLGLGQNGLVGNVPSELGSLAELQSLALFQNRLSGPIPPELGSLTVLGNLILSNNRLSGPIPPELGNLTELASLNLNRNELTGPLPPELGKLVNLTELRYSGNKLTGPLPPQLGSLAELGYWNSGDNQLSGSIPPELGNLKNLQNLTLGGNRFSGPIPPELGNLADLQSLSLDDNQLSGSIPLELGNLQNLQWLNLDFNPELSGSLPRSFTGLKKLNSLSVYVTQLCGPTDAAFQTWLHGVAGVYGLIDCTHNERDALIALFNLTDGPQWTTSTNWLSDSPLSEWHGVTADAQGRITGLNLSGNELAGSLPSQLGSLADLETLDLSLNFDLVGPLPQSLTNLSLVKISLEGTQLCAPPDTDFLSWLEEIPARFSVYCAEAHLDRYILTELYRLKDGPFWLIDTNWLSDESLGDWYGVSTDENGRVIGLNLSDNGLRGAISSGLSSLSNLTELNLGNNQLTGTIPPELGNLSRLKFLDLYQNQLSGSIPPELGSLANLQGLNLSETLLSGLIPPELGRLTNLEFLFLDRNLLSGPIPPELGNLSRLKSLDIHQNQLSGSIPPELGSLANLERLILSETQLTGPIPPELGSLTNLRYLNLYGNGLSDPIPSELGNLTNLETLIFDNNHLSGPIPSELGNLSDLNWLELSNNRLSGPIPSELGNLSGLFRLELSNNRLSGPIPSELGNFTTLIKMSLAHNELSGPIPSKFGQLHNIESLDLQGNAGLSGALPRKLTEISSLKELHTGGTKLCAPADVGFQSWLQGVPIQRVANCAITMESAAYLVQTTQSPLFPVPLIANEPALLRVFLTADGEVAMPPVRATFYQDGAEVHSVQIPGLETDVPRDIDEGDLATSANAQVPESIIMPGLEMVIEIDPDGTLDPALGIDGRLPASGRIALDVVAVPSFDLTLVPFLSTENPDRSVLTLTENLSAESDLFRLTRDILPVDAFFFTVREPVWTSVDPISSISILGETEVIRTMDRASGHYMGTHPELNGGIAFVPGTVSVSLLDEVVIAHELGHNMNLLHAPCRAGGPDPSYPYEYGDIGAWGYDLLYEELVSPRTPDLMGYCKPVWISDYHFTKALRYRASQEQALLAEAYAPSSPGLLLWGGVNEVGELVLEPAFAVDAPASLPRLDGPYRIVGVDEGGGTLLSLRFGMAEIADGEGGSFAFVIPVRADWPGRLDRITLSGPEGVATLGGEENEYDEDSRSAALLLGQITGRVRGLLRDWPEPSMDMSAVRRVLPEPGLEVVISRGIPFQEDWNR